MFSRVLISSVLLLSLLFLSCSQEGNVLLNVEDFTVESVENGTFLEPGSSVNIVFSEIGNSSRIVQISLEDEDGEVLATTEVEPEILKGLGMPLDIPEDLEDGLYYLRFKVLDEEFTLFEDERYFYLSDGPYSIINLETYPPGIKVGDEITGRVDIRKPYGSDPWLRWTLAGEVLQEGFISDMGLSCNFKVPVESGVFSLMVELFPVSPREKQISAVYKHSDLFVSQGEDALPWKDVEDRTYLYFIDLSDSLENRMNPDDQPQIVGEPIPSIHGNSSGYSFTEKDGLTFYDFALPLESENVIGDFLIALAFSYEELPAEGQYNIFSSGDENESFSIQYLAEERVFRAESNTQDQYYQSVLPLETLDLQEIIVLELSYTNNTNADVLTWMSGDVVLLRDEDFALRNNKKGPTVIGSDGLTPGMPMTVYTLAVSSGSYVPEGDSDNADDGSQAEAESVVPITERTIYERTEGIVDEIVIDDFIPGDGLASMVILTEKDSVADWVLEIDDKNGNNVYTINISEESILPMGKIVLSLINNDRGFYISSSVDNKRSGPLPFQDSLNMRIVAGSNDSINKITAIRYFQD